MNPDATYTCISRSDLLDLLNQFICAENTLSLCEEDGGVICSLTVDGKTYNYVGPDPREAMSNALQDWDKHNPA